MNHLLMHKIDVCLINFILFLNFSVANLFKQIFVNLKTAVLHLKASFWGLFELIFGNLIFVKKINPCTVAN